MNAVVSDNKRRGRDSNAASQRTILPIWSAVTSQQITSLVLSPHRARSTCLAERSDVIGYDELRQVPPPSSVDSLYNVIHY